MVQAKHAQHVGSLLRPPGVIEGFMRPMSGQQLSDEERQRLRVEIDEARRANVRELARLGFDASGGEADRLLYLGVLPQLFRPGTFSFAPDAATDLTWHDEEGRITRPEVTALKSAGIVGPLEPSGYHMLDSERFVLDEAGRLGDGVTTMVTIPSASHLAFGFRPGRTDRFHTFEQLFEVATPVLAAEAEALARAGFDVVQVDDPVSLQMGDPTIRAKVRDTGFDPDALLEHALRSDNQVMAAARSGGALSAVHLCNGNALSHRLADSGWDPIAPALFPNIAADLIKIEALDYMLDGWAALELVDPNTMVVLGLVSSKDPALEDPATVRRRIEDAAQHHPLENLALSPQCGFASHVLGNVLTIDDQWRKLELIRQIADEIWN
jgi:5-methyltetrahydropteroyltriglutamate--homocysteine methyltransferase